jgi:hypothetical protein
MHEVRAYAGQECVIQGTVDLKSKPRIYAKNVNQFLTLIRIHSRKFAARFLDLICAHQRKSAATLTLRKKSQVLRQWPGYGRFKQRRHAERKQSNAIRIDGERAIAGKEHTNLDLRLNGNWLWQ